VAGGLIDEEGADDGDEEHQVAGKSEEDAEAIAVETFVRAAAAVGALVPVFSVSASAGSLVGWRTATRTVVVVFEATLAVQIGLIWRDSGRHGVHSRERALWTDYSGFVSGVLSTVDWTLSGAHWGRNFPEETEY
jgi:hypothetical protein